MSYVTKKVIFPLRELSAFVKAINPKEKLELDLKGLDVDLDWYFLTKTKKMGAYFVTTSPTKNTCFIIGMDKNPSSVCVPKIYYVKDIDRWGSTATVYNPSKLKLEYITLLELYILYGFFIGNLSENHKPKLIKQLAG